MSSKIGIHFLKSFFRGVIWDIFYSWRATCNRFLCKIILQQFWPNFPNKNVAKFANKISAQILVDRELPQKSGAARIRFVRTKPCEREMKQILFAKYPLKWYGEEQIHISVLYQANLICQIGFKMMEQIHTYIPPSPTFGLWKADVIKDYVALQFLPVC